MVALNHILFTLLSIAGPLSNFHLLTVGIYLCYKEYFCVWGQDIFEGKVSRKGRQATAVISVFILSR